jgi:hypothetical protein
MLCTSTASKSLPKLKPWIEVFANGTSNFPNTDVDQAAAHPSR